MTAPRGESLVTRWTRRAVTIPGTLAAAITLFALLPLLAPLAALADALRGSRFAALRGLLAVASYLGCELVGLAACAALWFVGLIDAERAMRGNFRLQCLWASALFGAARLLFGLRVAVGGADVVAGGPVLVLLRHASVVDTLLPAVLISRRAGLRLRYVMKRELLWDPCLDVAGQRLPNAFVRRGSGDGAAEIARVRELASGLGRDEGVVICPEGTRYTPERRRQVLARLAETAEPKLVERARALQNLLPPRFGGVAALLDAAPEADVLLCVHTGFEGVRGLGDLWSGALVGRPIQVQFWRLPAASIPREPAARLDWLFEQWQRLDAWLEARPGASA